MFFCFVFLYFNLSTTDVLGSFYELVAYDVPKNSGLLVCSKCVVYRLSLVRRKNVREKRLQQANRDFIFIQSFLYICVWWDEIKRNLLFCCNVWSELKFKSFSEWDNSLIWPDDCLHVDINKIILHFQLLVLVSF